MKSADVNVMAAVCISGRVVSIRDAKHMKVVKRMMEDGAKARVFLVIILL
jgi:tartrate dehydratase beta subunit/fumarate hydratase class I family protein